jgi:acyl dehydratase
MSQASPSTEVGFELPSVRMAMSDARFERWYGPENYGGPPRNLHFDTAAAQAEGLPGPVATGPDISNLIFRSLMEFFGAGWVQGGKASLTIARPTYAHDFLVSKGYVKAVENENGATRLVCDVWVENQDGEKKVVGTASGLVKAS